MQFCLDLTEIQEAFKDEEIQRIMQENQARITRKSESQQSTNSNSEQSQTPNAKHDDQKNVESEDTAEVGDTLIESESAAVGSVKFDVYLRYFKSIGPMLIAFVFIFTLSSEASSVMSNCMRC